MGSFWTASQQPDRRTGLELLPARRSDVDTMGVVKIGDPQKDGIPFDFSLTVPKKRAPKCALKGRQLARLGVGPKMRTQKQAMSILKWGTSIRLKHVPVSSPKKAETCLLFRLKAWESAGTSCLPRTCPQRGKCPLNLLVFSRESEIQ